MMQINFSSADSVRSSCQSGCRFILYEESHLELLDSFPFATVLYDLFRYQLIVLIVNRTLRCEAWRTLVDVSELIMH